ncbi:META domain-containing protein [Streptomyces albofaciens]|uniref:META domain-containing protein n=1 Tax=Streptomyces albofaciens TaxID=66866 RepID=UPI00142EBFEC|nr:META domain-containing protein [Streptomyces albofaciens]
MALTGVLLACGTHTGVKDAEREETGAAQPRGTTPEPTPSRVPFTGTHWNIERLRLDDGVTAAPHGSAWFAFDGRGRVTGSLGCHRFRADADIDGRQVRIGEVRVSDASSASGHGGQRECSREQVTFEKYVKTLLRGGLRVDSGPSADMGFLVDPRKDGFQLQRGAPAPLIGTKWSVQSLYEEDTQVPLTEIAPGIGEVHVVFAGDGTVRGNLGCNDFEARAEVAATTIRFSDPVTTTHRTCDDSAKAVEKRLLKVFREQAKYRLDHDTMGVSTGNDVPALVGGFSARKAVVTEEEQKEGEGK